VKEIQSRYDKESKRDLCAPSEEDVGASADKQTAKMAYFWNIMANTHKVESKKCLRGVYIVSNYDSVKMNL
jgi:hypothetical protein